MRFSIGYLLVCAVSMLHISYVFSAAVTPTIKPFSVLLTSDVHIGPVIDPMQQQKLVAMQKYIQESPTNVQSVILAGDLAEKYGKKIETDAFKNLFFIPLVQALTAKISNQIAQSMGKDVYPGAGVYLGVGNHDTYWNQEYAGTFINQFLSEPYPTAMMRFLQSTNHAYQYSFMLGGIKFINLGLYPSFSFSGGIKTEKGISSLNFLMIELMSTIINFPQTHKKDPVILFFHYPMSGSWADWWSKAEKDALYDAIKNYNILAILVGHAHVSSIHYFRGRIPTIQAADGNFADIHIDPANDYAINISYVNNMGITMPATSFVSTDTFEPDLAQ